MDYDDINNVGGVDSFLLYAIQAILTTILKI
jgi:hypothetical protein